jgi:hypothetical protein
MSEDSLEHNPSGDRWERHADGNKRDRERDREVREAIRREASGEYDEDGNFRRSAWTDAG